MLANLFAKPWQHIRMTDLAKLMDYVESLLTQVAGDAPSPDP